MVGAILAIAVVGAGWGAAALARVDAAFALEGARQTNAALLIQQRNYSEVSAVLGQLSSVSGQLETLFADDVSSSALVRALRDVAPEGTAISSARISLGETGGTGAVLDLTGLEVLGRLELTGRAADERGMRELVQEIGSVNGVTVPYLVSSRSTDAGVEFTMQATLLETLRTERYGASDGDAVGSSGTAEASATDTETSDADDEGAEQ